MIPCFCLSGKLDSNISIFDCDLYKHGIKDFVFDKHHRISIIVELEIPASCLWKIVSLGFEIICKNARVFPQERIKNAGLHSKIWP